MNELRKARDGSLWEYLLPYGIHYCTVEKTARDEIYFRTMLCPLPFTVRVITMTDPITIKTGIVTEFPSIVKSVFDREVRTLLYVIA